jgi:hypothetical protein
MGIFAFAFAGTVGSDYLEKSFPAEPQADAVPPAQQLS